MSQMQMQMLTFSANNAPQSAVFKEALETQEELGKKSDILMLHEIAGKLMEVVREAEAKRDAGGNLYHAAERDITPKVKRVFHQAVKVGQDGPVKGIRRGEDDIRRTRRRQDNSGKGVILIE
jgi:hypothetical protein